jgi:hypothetical protein
MPGHPGGVIRAHPPARERRRMSAYPGDRRAQNWAGFVAILFVVVGCFNLIDAIAAYTQDDYFAADELLFGDLSMWGTLYLIVGAAQLLAAFLIWRGSIMGQILGITLAVVNAMVALLSVGAYPVWAIIILVFNGVVIYALTVYGDAFATR